MNNIDNVIKPALDMLNSNGFFILESSPRDFSILPVRIKKYGDTQLAIWKNEA